MRGADRVIPRLADRFPIAITTTADRAYVTHVLSRERLDRHIELIVTNADVPRPKPAPDMLDTVARYFGIKMNRLWLVGDTDADRDMAGAARAKFIHFGSAGTASRSRSVIAVESWRELARLLGA
jgi:phosphoglycolate phosphatase-like HAD superfamily hydrolase